MTGTQTTCPTHLTKLTSTGRCNHCQQAIPAEQLGTCDRRGIVTKKAGR